MTIIVHYK